MIERIRIDERRRVVQEPGDLLVKGVKLATRETVKHAWCVRLHIVTSIQLNHVKSRPTERNTGPQEVRSGAALLVAKQHADQNATTTAIPVA